MINYRALAQPLRRTQLFGGAQVLGSRRLNRFNYPHSYTGTNSSHTSIPQTDIYPEINRNMQPGDLAPYAHQNLRKFPDWYKPYGFNYMGDGWLLFFLAGFACLGWSYLNDIKE